MDHIAEVFHLLSAKYKDGLFWVIAGDKNEMKVDQILNLNSNFKQCVDQPTRLNPPAMLDPIITDLHKYYQRPICENPLEVDLDKSGSPSDHLMVIMTPLNNVNSIKGRQKKKIEFRPLNDEGFGNMKQILEEVKWDFIESESSVDQQMECFQNLLYKIFDISFPVKSKTIFNETEPFFTEKLIKLKRLKCREFNKHRMSAKYQSLNNIYKVELSKAKKSYYRKKIRNLRTSNPRMWHKQLKILMTGSESQELPEVESIKHLPDSEQAELIADKFAEVSNLYDELDRNAINVPSFSEKDIPKFTEKEVIVVIESLAINKSVRKNDVPAKILKHFAKYLGKPLSMIINNAISNGIWPDILKTEIVTPIPKVNEPKEIDDLRNISGLMNFNKVMEKLICKLVIEDMKGNMDSSQFGNLKGVSIQHYLVKMLDRVLSAIDKNSQGEVVAVVATFVDWKQAFPRQCPTLAIKSFIRNGVRPALIPIIMSFFENRRMMVKWHGVLSELKKLKGGGPQGSTWGVLSYMSQSNDNADMVPPEDRFKYFDDLTFLEIINLLNIGIATYNLKEHVPNNIPVHNQIVKSDQLLSQGYVEKINEWTERNKMVLNAKKSKNMIFNFTKQHQFMTSIELKGQKLEMLDEIKLLGTIITSDLKWDRNTEKIVKSSNAAMRVLHAASKFINERKILKEIYYVYVRSRLEHSAVVWNSSLTQKNINDLERVQKAAVRVIYGNNNYVSYLQALQELGMDSLADRREKMCLKFAKNCLKIDNMKQLFPRYVSKCPMLTRNKCKYAVNRSLTERYRRSAIPDMQRKLNKSLMEQRKLMNNIVTSEL